MAPRRRRGRAAPRLQISASGDQRRARREGLSPRRVQFTTNQATFALPDAGVLFKVMVALPVEVLGTALTAQTPVTGFCRTASTSEAVDRETGASGVGFHQ